MRFLRILGEEGLRIFTTDQAREYASRAGIRDSYVNEALHHLERSGWIVRLRRGLYALSSSLPGFAPPHEFEIAMALAEDAMVSHHSALHFHGFTDQIPRQVYLTVPSGASGPSSSGGGIVQVTGIEYRIVRIKSDRHFGGMETWVGESRITLTDPERTLLDGLMRPWYCGDIGEVFHAFHTRWQNLEIARIIDYAVQLDDATAKRLGWILEQVGCPEHLLNPLMDLRISGYRNLDPEGPAEGPLNSRWMIRENLTGWISG